MNTNNVVSHKAAVDLAGKEYRRVKLTSTGIDLAAASDRAIGTVRRGNVKAVDGVFVAGVAVDIYLSAGKNVDYAMLGNTSAAIALGAGLIPDTATGNEGMLIPSESDPIAIAWQAVTGASGSVIQVLFL